MKSTTVAANANVKSKVGENAYQKEWKCSNNGYILEENKEHKTKKKKLNTEKTLTQNKNENTIKEITDDNSKEKQNYFMVLETTKYRENIMSIGKIAENKTHFIRKISFLALSCFSWLNPNRRQNLTFCEETIFIPKKKKENQETEKEGHYINANKKDESKFDIFVDKKTAINSILSSTFAGIISRTVTAPLDRIKYMLQITNNLSIYEIFENIKKDGIVTGFFRGNCVNIIKIVPELSIKMYSYEFLKINVYKYYYQKNNIDWKNEESIDIPFFLRFLIGSSSGLFAAFCIYPLEIVKTRLIVSNKKADNGIIGCVYNIYKNEKLRNFYNGLCMHLYGVVLFSGCNMSIYDYLKYIFFFYYKNYVHLKYCLKNNVDNKLEQCTDPKGNKYNSKESTCDNLSEIRDVSSDLENNETDEQKLLSLKLEQNSDTFYKETAEALEAENVNPIKGSALFTAGRFANMHNLMGLYNAKNSKLKEEFTFFKKLAKEDEGKHPSFCATENNYTTYASPPKNCSNMSNSKNINLNITNDSCSYCEHRIKNVNCFLFLFFGMTSSFIAQIVSYPFLVLRTRMQTLNNEITTNYLNDNRKKIKSCNFIIYNIKMYGFRSLYRGIYVNLLKTIPATSITWFSYEFSMRKLQNL